jgi:CPA2 family monovalent cation:H+ antiporter-2
MGGAEVLLELGAVVLGLAVLARIAGRIGVPAIPLYLVAGLAFGHGGLLPLVTTTEFVEVGAEIGLILLLLMLGLDHSAAELLSTVNEARAAGAINLIANAVPGLLAGLLLGWDLVAAVFLAGITYASSSGIVAKLITDLGRTGNRETPSILSMLVVEDLVIAVYLPVVAGLLIGESSTAAGLLSAGVAVALVGGTLALSLKVEVGLSRALFSHSDEALLLSILGVTVLVAGAAELANISAAIGALLVGIALSGPAAEGARPLLTPLRDFFAAIFFAFFGLSVDPSTLPEMLAAASLLAFVTAVTKFMAGWWAARSAGVGTRGRARAGTTMIARGEFSIAIAGLGVSVGIEPELGSLAAAYVLILAVLGPIAARLTEPITERLLEWRERASN